MGAGARGRELKEDTRSTERMTNTSRKEEEENERKNLQIMRAAYYVISICNALGLKGSNEVSSTPRPLRPPNPPRALLAHPLGSLLPSDASPSAA
jgi:hypothetical protein